jgi:hypothetical protein
MSAMRCHPVFAALVGCALAAAAAAPARADETARSAPASPPSSTTPVQTTTEMHDKGMAIGGGITLGLGLVTFVSGLVPSTGGGWGLSIGGPVMGIGAAISAIGLPILIVGAHQETKVPERPPGPTHTNSVGMMAAGGILLGTGALAIGGGAVGFALSQQAYRQSPVQCYEDSLTVGPSVDAECQRQIDAHDAEFQREIIGSGTAIAVGLASIAVGIPLLAVGAKQVPIDVTVSVGLGSAQIRGFF